MPSLIILICTTTIASAVMWKTHIYAVPAIRPTLVKSQIYTLVNNRTLVDAHLNKLQNAGKIRLLKLEDETDDSLGIMLSEDYIASFKDIEKFTSIVLTEQRALCVNKSTLLKTFSDAQITTLVQSGALTARTSGLWWVSSPCLGRFLKAYRTGQRALLAMLRRQRFKELLLSDIAKRELGKGAILGYMYHVLAHLGSGTLVSVPTASGPLIRLRMG
ncbi:Serine/threonine-protein kinase 19 [Clonorchis sinensis]|uniref:Serine/threonine-protein kinase 19 n=1 Tax=Clonorchis sinensis TaxID=79923 RepID=A0A419PTE8_CLOSI|nr:Serine/threonine-protein kinase 19 [Clonorchis sinensis]